MPKKIRHELGASQTCLRHGFCMGADSFLRDVAELVQVSQKKIARSMFGRTNFAFRWQRWYIRQGVMLVPEFVSALSRGDRCVQDWMMTHFVGECPFPITCEGRIRCCAAPDRPKCKRRVPIMVRGIKQLA